jgi:hypothetical protein
VSCSGAYGKAAQLIHTHAAHDGIAKVAACTVRKSSHVGGERAEAKAGCCAGLLSSSTLSPALPRPHPTTTALGFYDPFPHA